MTDRPRVGLGMDSDVRQPRGLMEISLGRIRPGAQPRELEAHTELGSETSPSLIATATAMVRLGQLSFARTLAT